MADSTYQKSGLQSNQIRILILLPIDQDLDDAFIQCRLVSTSIENPVLYEALSYTWGDDALAPTRYIDCDGEVVPVTVNLYEALMALRYNESPRTLWVDALCINQSNSQERNHQVALMALIYRRAIGVLIWVGMEGPARDGERSFRYLKELYDVVCKNSKNVRQDGSAVADERYTWGQAPPAHPSVEFVLDLFLSRSWFRRRWILQEVYNAQEAKIYCGQHYMRWEEFVVGFLHSYYVLNHKYRLPLPVYNVPHADRSLILDHLDLFVEYGCQDPRDKILSLLSLDEGNSFPPDYTLTTSGVFTAFAQHSVLEGFGAQVLAHASWQPYTERTTSDLAMPSWVPDWRKAVRDATMPNSKLKSQWKDLKVAGIGADQWRYEQASGKEGDRSDGERYEESTRSLPLSIPGNPDLWPWSVRRTLKDQPAVRLSECKAKLTVNALLIGTVESLSLPRPMKLPGPTSRFGKLDRGQLVIRRNHAQTHMSKSVGGMVEDATPGPAGALYKGHYSGSIEPGDTVCYVKGTGLTIALRPRQGHAGEWQLVRWCTVLGFAVEDQGSEAAQNFCIA